MRLAVSGRTFCRRWGTATLEHPRRRPSRPRLDLRHQSVLKDWHPEDDETYRCAKVTGETTVVASLARATFDRMQLEGISFQDARLTSVIFTDSLLHHCDLAGLKAESSSMLRTEIVDSRLTGGSWSEGALRHVRFRSCRMQYVSFRQQRFGVTLFEDCDLRDSDFQAADLRGAAFIRCDLTHVQLSNASLDGARFEDCNLEMARGVGALRGATIGLKEMLSLAPSMAAALGITIGTEQVPAADPDASGSLSHLTGTPPTLY
jgi:uncharacterized protein YjbI with pentapeptide repeats